VSGHARLALSAIPIDAAINTTINSQARLAYAGNTGMFVSRNTFVQLSQPTVKYGLATAMN
jgi:hypothetical protein